MTRPSSPRAVAAVGALALVLLVAAPVGAVAPPIQGTRAAPASASSIAALALEAADRSLAEGFGPAAGAACGAPRATVLPCLERASFPAVHVDYGFNRTVPWTLWPLNQTHPPPDNRDGYSMAYDPADQYVVLYGGYNAVYDSLFNDTWTFHNGLWTQLDTPVFPPSRQGASMAWDPSVGAVVLFGGGDTSGTNILNETWWFVHGKWSDHTASAPNATNTPPARYFGMMDWDPDLGKLVLFGGCGGYECNDLLNDTWVYSDGLWSEDFPALSPPARVDGSMVFDPSLDASLLFGGLDDAGALNDTWQFSGGIWVEDRSGSSPPAAYGAWMAWDPNDDYAVLFGGATDDGLVNGTWTFQNGTWFNVSGGIVTAPTARYQLSGDGVYDAADGYDLLFGGLTAQDDSNGTWIFDWSLHAILNASRTAIDQNQTVRFQTLALGGTAPYRYTYYGLPTGCSSIDAPSIVCRFGTVGPVAISVNVTDYTGNYTNRTLNLTVYPPLSATAVVTPDAIDLGSVATYSVTPTGGSGDLSYVFGGLPLGCGTYDKNPIPCLPDRTGNWSSWVNLTDLSGAFLQVRDLNLTVFRALHVAATARRVDLDLGQTLTLNASASGGDGTLTPAWIGLPPGCAADAAAWNVTCTPSAAGNYPLYVNVTDELPNTVSSVTFPVWINATPTLSVRAAATQGLAPFTATLSYDANLGVPPYSVAWRFGDGSGEAAPAASLVTHLYTVPGRYTVTAFANDSAGTAFSSSLTIDVVSPLAVHLASAPASEVLDAGEPLLLTANVTGGGSPLNYSWTGLPQGCPGADAPTIACTPTSWSDYKVTVTVSDPLGERNQSSLTLAIDPPLTAALLASAASSGCTLPYDENLTASVGGGLAPFRVAWSFGDGGTNASALDHVHPYESAGTYTARFTVTDATNASAIANATFHVGPSGCASGFLGLSDPAWGGIAVVLVVVAIAAVWLTRRRGPGTPASPPPADAPADENASA